MRIRIIRGRRLLKRMIDKWLKITAAESARNLNGKQTEICCVSQTRPATAKHPETGEEVWFNQADGFHSSNLDEETKQWFVENNEEFRLNAHFGDGSPIAVTMLEQIREVMKKETIPHRWQTGDILILDNLLTAHGRMPFSGQRKIALAMT